MHYSLNEQLRLLGPKLFEELCAQLVKADFPNSLHVEGTGGDKGIDIFNGELDLAARSSIEGTLQVWQVKFFRDGLKRRQREQAEKSLKRVISTYRPTLWTICIPISLDTGAHEWIQTLRTQYQDITITEPIDADEIVKRLLETKNESLRNTFFLLPQQISQETLKAILPRLDDFANVSDLIKHARHSLAITPKNALEFYNGAIPDWKDIEQSFDSYRERFGDLWKFIVAHANNPIGRIPFALITGRSGDGKSTVLMRLAAELVSQGYNLVFYHKDDRLTLHAEQLCNLPRDMVSFVLIDKITRFDAGTLRGFFERLYRESIPVIIVGAAVRSTWEGLNLDLNNIANVCEIKLDQMTDRDIEAILDKLGAEPELAQEYLGRLALLSREEQLNIFRQKADRQLLVALLESKRSQAFESYVIGELEQLSNRFGSEVRKSCILVSALHRLDLPMPRRLIERLIPNTDFDEVLQNTHGILTETEPKGMNILTRHALVAEVIFSSDNRARNHYEQIINAAIAKTYEERLTARMINILILRNERRLADSLLENAIRRFPNNGFLMSLQASLSLWKGNLDQAKQQFSRSIKHYPTSYDLNALAILESKMGNIGNKEDPQPNTARWLFAKAAEIDPNQSFIWRAWASVEKLHGNIGEKEDPAPRTTRWLLRQAVKENHTDTWALIDWATLESEHNNIGEKIHPAPGTARWLFAKAAAISSDDASIWAAWAKIEKEHNNLGDIESPEPNTARWLLIQATKVDASQSSKLISSAILEKEQGNIGNILNPEPLTARWYFLQAVEAVPWNPGVWIAWAKMEAEIGNVGAQDNPDANTARWLFAKAVEAQPKNFETRCKWARFEIEQGHIGEKQSPRQNTARWLFAKATELDPDNDLAWSAWAKLEKERGYIGDKDNPMPGTARWLFAKASESNPNNASIWNVWAKLEAEQGNIGESHNPKQFTTRWLFMRALKAHPLDVPTLVAWASTEKMLGNFGSKRDPEPHTARWLYAKAFEAYPLGPTRLAISYIMRLWAILEADQDNIGDRENPAPYTARWLFNKVLELDKRDVKTLIDYANMRANTRFREILL